MPTPADPAVELKRLVMGVEHQLLGLAKIYSDERHTAVRQLHVRRLDRQRESLERDRLVAPVELVGFPWLEAHRHISMGGNSGPFLTPELCEAMHAVVRAVISAPTKLFEQPLRRTALPLRQLGFRLENLRQRIDPNAKLRRRLNVPSVFELGSEASDHLANRRPRHRKRPHDLLDRETLFEIGAPYLADLVHPNIPIRPSQPTRPKGRTLTHRSEGVVIGRESSPSGGHYCKRFWIGPAPASWYQSFYFDNTCTTERPPIQNDSARSFIARDTTPGASPISSG